MLSDRIYRPFTGVGNSLALADCAAEKIKIIPAGCVRRVVVLCTVHCCVLVALIGNLFRLGILAFHADPYAADHAKQASRRDAILMTGYLTIFDMLTIYPPAFVRLIYNAHDTSLAFERLSAELSPLEKRLA